MLLDDVCYNVQNPIKRVGKKVYLTLFPKPHIKDSKGSPLDKAVWQQEK